MAGLDASVVDLSYSSVTVEGTFVLSASKDSTAMLSREDGTYLKRYDRHDAPVWSCSLDRNAVYAATASVDCTVKIWRGIEHEDGLPKVLETHQNPCIVLACAFWETTAMDLLIGDINGHISVFRLGYDQAPLYSIQPVTRHDEVVGSVRAVGCLSPHTFVSTYSDMTIVRFWIQDLRLI